MGGNFHSPFYLGRKCVTDVTKFLLKKKKKICGAITFLSYWGMIFISEHILKVKTKLFKATY